MKYRTAGAFRAALEQRLKARADEEGVPVGRLRKLVVFERLLARLAECDRVPWALKGGFALELRSPFRARMTRDVDIDREGTEEAALPVLRQAAAAELGDFFEFQIERVNAPEDVHGGGARFRATAILAARLFDVVLVDVGFSDRVSERVDRLVAPGLLEFADIRPATVPAAPLTQHVAEKLHAYTRSYGAGEHSSRVKDLVDIVLISHIADFELAALRDGMVETFGSRGTHAVPERLPRPPQAWSTAYARLAEEAAVEPDVESGYERAARFLDPVLAESAVRRWRPDCGWIS